MNALKLRKQLLIVESELNRAQLTSEVAAIKSGVHRCCHRTSKTAIATSAAAMALDLAAKPRGHKTAAGSNHVWLQNTLKGAALISSIGLALLTQRDK